jgi:hypothetical protein
MFTPRWNHLLQLLPWRKGALRRVAPLHDLDSTLEEDERPLGCGWFDSSHDLQHGLQVNEADGRVLALLPLADWLALQVRPCYEADTPADTPADISAGMIVDPTLH